MCTVFRLDNLEETAWEIQQMGAVTVDVEGAGCDGVSWLTIV